MAVTPGTSDKLELAFVEDWASRMLAAWNAHDADAVASMCSEDVYWIDPSLAEPVHGREAVRAFVQASAETFPDLQIHDTGPHFLSPTEPRVLSPYRMTGTMLGDWEGSNLAATGARISVEGVDEWTFRGELMCRYRTYYDSLDMARQIGILPPAGSTAERAMARLQHLQARFQRRKARRSPR